MYSYGFHLSFRRLDLSNNKLRSLPAEIGDCVKLQELMLNNNYMRMLPYELGKLFQLVILGLKGNPLGPDILQLYAEPNGTKKLLEHMLDNLHGMGKTPISRRRRSSQRIQCSSQFISLVDYLVVHETFPHLEKEATPTYSPNIPPSLIVSDKLEYLPSTGLSKSFP